jgi:hypothetical protein
MQERYEVYEVTRHTRPGKGLHVEWELVFTAETPAGVGTGMAQQSEDYRASHSHLTRSSYIPPHYAVYDIDEDWWISGPPDPLIGFRRGEG